MSDNPRPQERQHTDASLRAEREKVDKELAAKRAVVEEDADRVVRTARDKADLVLEDAREKVEQGSEGSRASVLAEQVKEDATIAQERTTADAQLAEERAARKQALARLLVLEREATDDDLVIERARADEAVATRDDFLAMVSHDLRTLLGSVALHAAMIVREEPGEKLRKRAESVQRCTARMNRLVGDLMDVVSMEGGKLGVALTSDDASGVVREIVETYQPAMAAKEIILTSEVTSALANFDHERVLQVLANLLSNALKFTPKGGNVAIRVASKAGQVVFSVSDTGPGIPVAKHEAVFERFWQSAPGDRRGLGLGLYISRSIVESHGGKIWVENNAPANTGCTFFFTIPG